MRPTVRNDGQVILSVENLTIGAATDRGLVTLVDGVSFQLRAGRTLCIVGESGSGKTMAVLSLIRLLPSGVTVLGGKIDFEGEDVLGLDHRRIREIRGSRVGTIFQEPMTALNPSFTVGNQLAEAILAHHSIGYAQAWERATALLHAVKIAAAEQRMSAYPHELSGGMRQRVAIAMAVANKPSILLADEPTTALDVTVQSQILALLGELRRDTGAAILFITHDLGVVRQMADEVLVLYAGHVMESGSVDEIFEDPQHPYTIGLLGALPSGLSERKPLTAIPGTVPSAHDFPPGCRFSSRCALVQDRCRVSRPPLREFSASHKAACWRAPIELAAG